MRYPKLIKVAAVLAILVLAVVILVYAKPFLAPITFAALLAMLLLPVSEWLERKGVGKVVSILLSILLLIGFFALVGFFLSWQISDLSGDLSDIEKKVGTQYQKAQHWIGKKVGISPEKQEEMIKQQQKSSSGQMSSMITGFLSGLGGILTDIVLVLVYIFLFMYFQDRLKKFVIRVVPDSQEKNAQQIVNDAQQVTQKYLSGMALMIAALWIMYGIGFSIVGIKNAVLFAILCGILEIIPFVGNLTGTVLTVVMTLVQGGDSRMIVGILITYGLVQFIQTYLLEPLVVGSEVNINPLFTIMGLVAGELVWGVAGMVVAIPVLGITKIICDHIEPLKPYGYLIGAEKSESSIKGKLKQLGQTVKGWFGKKK